MPLQLLPSLYSGTMKKTRLNSEGRDNRAGKRTGPGEKRSCPDRFPSGPVVFIVSDHHHFPDLRFPSLLHSSFFRTT